MCISVLLEGSAEDEDGMVCSGMTYDDVCKTGNTLLWDLVQEELAVSLSPSFVHTVNLGYKIFLWSQWK